MGRRRVAVLISGGGTNLQALIDATRSPATGFEVALVLASRGDAYGLKRAAAAGIPTRVVEHRAFPDRPSFEAEIGRAVAAADTEIIALAGFMRVLTADFVTRWSDRLLNIHPSLLPAFPGLHTHARALAAGVRVAGCTVHLVRVEVDSGPILGQGVVPVRAGDTAETLAARVLEVEHRIYPTALDLFARGGLRVLGERIIAADPQAEAMRLVLHPALQAATH